MADGSKKSQFDKITSPNQLDKMLVISSSSFWIVLIGGALVILVALIWSLTGSLPLKVEANGIYIANHNTYTLSSEINGIVSNIYVSKGDIVNNGDVLYTLDTKSLDKEKTELLERRSMVEAVTLDSKGDVSNSDTQSLLDIKNEIKSAGSQVMQNETMLELRERELEDQKVRTEEAKKAMDDARKAVEDYQNQNYAVADHYELVNNAWSNVITCKSAMDAAENVMQEATDNLDYYAYFAESSDPQEKAQYDAAENTYESSVDNYYSNKADYEAALFTYNNLLSTYFPDAQPSVAPDKQSPDLVTYVNAYNSEVANLQQRYELLQAEYSNEYSKQSNLEAEIASLKVEIAAGVNVEGVSVASLKSQFANTKEATLDSLDQQIKKYDETIQNNVVKSPASGVVSDIKISVGNMVTEGSSTIVIKKATSEGDIVVCYVPLRDSKKIEPGMDVKIYPSTVNRQEYGNMIAKVQEIDPFVTSEAQMKNILGDESLAASFASIGPVNGVKCKLEEDPETASGYKWSSKKGAEVEIKEGTLVDADIITEYRKPISLLLPYLKEKFTQRMDKEETTTAE